MDTIILPRTGIKSISFQSHLGLPTCTFQAMVHQIPFNLSGILRNYEELPPKWQKPVSPLRTWSKPAGPVNGIVFIPNRYCLKSLILCQALCNRYVFPFQILNKYLLKTSGFFGNIGNKFPSHNRPKQLLKRLIRNGVLSTINKIPKTVSLHQNSFLVSLTSLINSPYFITLLNEQTDVAIHINWIFFQHF